MTGSSKKIFWLALAVLAALAILAGGKFLYLLFYLALFLFIIPYTWLRISLNRLHGRVKLTEAYAEVGQSINVQFIINNHPAGWFPYLELTSLLDLSLNAASQSRIVCLDPGEETSFNFNLYCRRRGKYDLQAFSIKTGDPFGIFKLSKPLFADREITVYPRLKPLPLSSPQASQNFGNLAVGNRQFENYSQVSDLRSWRAGDNMKKIHWKQSARHERLLVKNYDQKGDTTLNLLIDMAASAYRGDWQHLLEDLAVEVATSLIYQNLKHNLAVKIFSQPFHRYNLVGSQPRDFWGIIDQVVTLAATASGSFCQYVNTTSYYLTPNSTLYLISPCLEPEAVISYLALRLKGFNLILFYLRGGETTPNTLKLLTTLREAGIRVLPVTFDPEENDERAAL